MHTATVTLRVQVAGDATVPPTAVLEYWLLDQLDGDPVLYLHEDPDTGAQYRVLYTGHTCDIEGASHDLASFLPSP
jgi:hypothetical protein